MYQVLIVDEDPGFLAITKIFLEHSGSIFAETALTADEALQILSGDSYDAVIFGTLQDSLRDGTMVHTIRERTGPVPVLLMVEEYQAEEGVVALKNGVSHVIVRTIDPKEQFHELITAVRDLVDQSREEVAFQFHDAILSLVTRSAQRFLTESADPDGILSLFTSFGEATGIARASLISLKPDAAGIMAPRVEVIWNAKKTDVCLSSADPGCASRMNSRVLMRIAESIREGDNFISSTREFSRDELEDGGFTDITGILSVPVTAGGELWGGIILEDAEHERTWSEIEIDAVRGMADIIGAAIYSETQKERVLFLSAMVQQVSDAVIAYNGNNRIVYANTAAATLLETDAETLKGQDFGKFFRESQNPERMGGIYSMPEFAVLVTADGKEVMVDAKVTPLSSGKDAGTMVAVLRDATERIHHHRMQSEAFARIDDDIRMMERLGENIRDPLMIILGHAELAGGDSAEIIVSQVQKIQEKMRRLDSAQLKSSYYRKILRASYSDQSPMEQPKDEEQQAGSGEGADARLS